MEKIRLIADNVYSRLAIKSMLRQTEFRLAHSMAIYIIERLTPAFIQREFSNRVPGQPAIIICHPEALLSVLDVFSVDRYYFCPFDSRASTFKRLINNLSSHKLQYRQRRTPGRSSVQLSELEKLVILHYINGLRGIHISEVVERSDKIVSMVKRNIMRKLGLRTNRDLLEQGRIRLLIENEDIDEIPIALPAIAKQSTSFDNESTKCCDALLFTENLG